MTTRAGDAAKADVIVVGSGVAGALVAYELAKSGIKVTILEAGDRLDRASLVDRSWWTWRRDLAAPYPRYAHAPVPDFLSQD